MAIIGKLIKKSNEINYRRFQKLRTDQPNQLSTLQSLLSFAKKTAFGDTYDFTNILKSDNIENAFQQLVPITEYDAFHDQWLTRAMAGEKDVIWPGKIKFFALSSGTSGSPSKRIPITGDMIRSFQKSSISQLTILHEFGLSEDFYNGQILTVGGSAKLKKIGPYYEGDLSGILKKFTSFIVSPITKPAGKIVKEQDWSKKLEMMVDKAPDWDISLMVGIPSWCILLLEKIVAKYKLNNIHELWPNLKVYAHGGVFMDPYIARLNRLVGSELHLLDTYLASEGYFAFQTTDCHKGMQLLLNSGIFFEFVPFNGDYFDQEGNLLDDKIAFNIDEVQPNIDYALIITTNAGLWRYMIGDLVKFVDIELREIVISGRIKQYLSLCGEHLSLDNINQALGQTAAELNIDVPEFTIYADEEAMQHNWYVGADMAFDKVDFITKTDYRLQALNDDYHCARKINLKTPNITVLPVGKFYDFMASRGKLGAQNKFPRVLNKPQSKDWLEFLEKDSV